MSGAHTMSEAEAQYEYYRRYRMSDMMEATERKLAGLYREAARYGMTELLESRSAFSEAWDREIIIAKLEAGVRGNDETTMLGNGI